MDGTIAFQGEVMLLRWSETSNQGATITLQLSDAGDLERFKTMTLAKGKQAGQRLAAVMVEIGDDEQPVIQPITEKSLAVEKKEKPGDLCVMACKFCADPQFRRWLVVDDPEVSTCSELDARKAILDWCGIGSRKKLDTDERAARIFHNRIRKPFLAWLDTNSARTA